MNYVDIDWQKKVEGHGYKDGINWHRERIVGYRKMFGRSYVLLEGRPFCPVREERVMPHVEK